MISLSFHSHAYLYVLKVAKSRDMVHTAKSLLFVEKGWLLSQIGKSVGYAIIYHQVLNFMHRTHSRL
jgi:hypothetical protein